MLMVLTAPAASNSVCKSASVVSYGRFPTYSLVFMNYSSISRDAMKSDGRLERNAQRRTQERREFGLGSDAAGRKRTCQKAYAIYHNEADAHGRAWRRAGSTS